MVVVYHDVNDFFYSGHVGLSYLLMRELWICGDKWGTRYGLFVLVFEWGMLTVSRAHYVIDMVCGLVSAAYILRQSERIAYYIDVKLLGLT